MTVFICVLEAEPKRLEWDQIFLPRVGEHLNIADFMPDINAEEAGDDVLKVVDLQWIKLKGEICTVLFLGSDDSEITRIKSFLLN